MKAFSSTPSRMSLFVFCLTYYFFKSTVCCPVTFQVFNHVSLWIYLPAQHRQYSSTPLYSLCPRVGQRGGASRLMFIGFCWKTGRELEQSCAPGSVHALFHLLSTHRIPKKEYICVSLIKLVGIKYNIMNVNQSLLQLRTVKRSDLAMFQTRFPFPHLLPGACL